MDMEIIIPKNDRKFLIKQFKSLRHVMYYG